ncbi:carbohydrate esterase family 4 protein [Peniophora sp. CONT]|nr:carbohydrate esterase family 4 protein [Peniophora sp. CONT]
MVSTWLCLTPLLALASSAQAHPGHNHAHIARSLASRTATPGEHAWWHRDEQHFAHKLFKRGPTTDGITYPEVGSPTWAAAYPTSTPDSNAMPQEWKDALDAAVKAGKIPNLAPSTNDPNAGPVYPKGVDPMSPDVCSATYKCRLATDMWDAPDGQVGISFDDGPIPGSSDVLYQFLQENNVQATHFFIGVNILWGSKEFMTAYEELQGDIAVHTWTHPYMTTLSNEDVVAQLGWTMEIIHNSTGGRIPRFWRPPYGDSDIRVSAIAREVFGMTTIQWNHDTADWTLTTGDGYTTPAKIHSQFQSWLTGARSPGLIVLEHELSQQSVQAFIDAYPLIVQNNWNIVSVVDIDGNGTYQNAINSTSAILGNSNITSGKNLGSAYALASSMAAASASPSATAGSQQASPSASSAGSSSSPGAGSNVSHSGAAALTGAPFASLSALVFGALLGALLL